jgi:hypothetical protein
VLRCSDISEVEVTAVSKSFVLSIDYSGHS